MGPIALLRSLWTFPHVRRMGSPGGCGYYLPLFLPPTAAAAVAADADAAADAAAAAAADAATSAAAAAAATAAAAAAAICRLRRRRLNKKRTASRKKSSSDIVIKMLTCFTPAFSSAPLSTQAVYEELSATKDKRRYWVPAAVGVPGYRYWRKIQIYRESFHAGGITYFPWRPR